ncbi:MAG: hypothetical protein J5614_04745 [Paludibacteraceae bacterium]|nr:hypothetical protein [Paludibacteraceae bacterium]
MDKKDILKDLFGIMYDWIKPIITERHDRLGGCWYNDSGAFYWDCVGKSSGTDAYIGARLCGDTDDIVIWTGNKNNIVIVIHPVEKGIFTGIYSIDVMLNTTAEFEDFSKQEMEDLYHTIIDFYKETHAVIHSKEELSDQYTTMSIQDVPEGQVICEKTLEKDTMEESKELSPFVKTRCIPGFDTDALKIGHPYRVTSERYGEQIMFLNKSSETLLHFFKLVVYDGEVQRQEEYLVSIDNVVHDGYIIQEMK